MTKTLSLKEELLELQLRLPQLEGWATAEASFLAATGTSGKWKGAVERLNTAKTQIRDLQLQLKGHELSKAVEELAHLDSELEKADAERQAADRQLAEMTTHPIVAKWLQAPNIARPLGYGHSWSLWSEWYLSNRGVRSGMPECALFLMGAECPEALRFNIEGDRQKIRAYNEQRGACLKAIVLRDSIAGQRALLLRERPELA